LKELSPLVGQRQTHFLLASSALMKESPPVAPSPCASKALFPMKSLMSLLPSFA